MLDFQDFIKDQALKANAVVRTETYTGFADDSLKRNYPVFGQSDADIADAKVQLHKKIKQVKWGCPIVLLAVIPFVAFFISDEIVAVVASGLVFGIISSIVFATMAERMNLLDAQMQTLEDCAGCPEMLELRTNSVVVAQYVDTVIQHRQLYCFDLQVARGLAKIEKAQVAAQQSAEKNRQACVALHSGVAK